MRCLVSRFNSNSAVQLKVRALCNHREAESINLPLRVIEGNEEFQVLLARSSPLGLPPETPLSTEFQSYLKESRFAFAV